MTAPKETCEGSGTSRKTDAGASEANRRGQFFFWRISPWRLGTRVLMLPDDEFLRAFFGLTLANSEFRHRDHLRLAWLAGPKARRRRGGGGGDRRHTPELAIDFFAFLRTGAWPVIVAISSTMTSSTFGCLIASPTPTLIAIFVSVGTWCEFREAELLHQLRANLRLVPGLEPRRGNRERGARVGSAHLRRTTSNDRWRARRHPERQQLLRRRHRDNGATRRRIGRCTRGVHASYRCWQKDHHPVDRLSNKQ